ncbi:hypothetical protein [Clostridium estertheticum]|uniref:hypothetical protein n=1 Tax=Clostridium estertheticum TaxID=238834 RepID=UPI001CF338CC|nr:hypothetical protein [Clostridium estertheticum]MCB2356039.1 hypothetical protein [Clostridium estertheticum]WAG42168.1 hypothetical protein LL065_05575 [Clostridium estertheticum]
MNKKIINSLFAALIIAGATSLSAYAAMADGTVVIGSKAFDLNYANSPVNLAEITKEIQVGRVVYVKGFGGNWINNITGLVVDGSCIPAVVYKNATKQINFATGDKNEIVSNVNANETVRAYELAPIDSQPQITGANALGAIAQVAVGSLTDVLTKDDLQSRINNENDKIAARVVYLQIREIKAVNGTITLTFNNPLVVKPEVSAFVVNQTIGTGVAIKVVPTAVDLDSTGKIITLTVPQVKKISTEQKVVNTVSYDTAVPVTEAGFKVAVDTSH